MKTIKYLFILLVTVTSFNCNTEEMNQPDNFKYMTEQFADLGILRYKIPGFEELPLKQKEMLYYLYEAALAGRDIYYDQNYKYNLKIRRTLEAIVDSYSGDREAEDFQKFMVYTKRVWFSNGIHHHYSNMKIMPDFSKEYFAELINNSNASEFPLADRRLSFISNADHFRSEHCPQKSKSRSFCRLNKDIGS